MELLVAYDVAPLWVTSLCKGLPTFVNVICLYFPHFIKYVGIILQPPLQGLMNCKGKMKKIVYFPAKYVNKNLYSFINTIVNFKWCFQNKHPVL